MFNSNCNAFHLYVGVGRTAESLVHPEGVNTHILLFVASSRRAVLIFWLLRYSSHSSEQSMPYQMLLLLVLALAAVHLTSAADITCQYFKAHLRNNNTRSVEIHLCRVDGINYQLPHELIHGIISLDLVSGTSQLRLRGMQLNTQNYEIQVLSGSSPHIDVLPQTRHAAKVVRTSGTRKVIVLRVISGSDRNRIFPSLSRQQLRDSIFGDPKNPGQCTFKSQYARCSQGQLNFVPASYRGSSYGVYDLIMTTSMKNRALSLDMQAALNRAFSAKFGDTSQYHHMMFCLPRGMLKGEFVALAGINDNVSFFSDPWCGSMSSTMHEIGHNMGMAHSGELGGGEYDDDTCLMGSSYPSSYGAHKCFNGQKMWAFNWWPNKKEVVNPIADGPWTGRLAAFVDVRSTTMPVVLRVGNLYLVFNRAKAHNVEAHEKADMVTIVNSPTASSNSLMRAGINASAGMDSYSCDAEFEQGRFSVMIEVCKIVKGVGAVDYVELSIRRHNSPSTCGTSRALAAPRTVSSQVAPGLPCDSDSDCSGSTIRCILGLTGRVCQQGGKGRSARKRGLGKSN